MLDALIVLVFLALVALPLLGPDRPAVRATGIGFALVALGLVSWEAIREGRWWMAVAGAVIGLVWAVLEERRGRPAVRERR